MSEKLLELSSVVNVISRTVADLEKQRQQNETRAIALNALVMAMLNALPSESRAEALRNFHAAAEGLLATATPTSRNALKKELEDVQRLLARSAQQTLL